MGKQKIAGICIIILFCLLGWANHLSNPLPTGTMADSILIEKSVGHLTLLSHGKKIKTYSVALGHSPEGSKKQEGDNRTPEGTYIINSKNPNSRYCMSLHISYPNTTDSDKARIKGVSPGGDILIHGIRKPLGFLGSFHRLLNWTKGCIAISNQEIREIYQAVPQGTPVEIKP